MPDDHVDAATRWDARYRESSGVGEPAAFLDEVAHWLPDGGTMVDVGGGTGANARWFAARGFSVTVVDVSAVALQHVAEWAAADGVSVECLQLDAEADGMPSGRTWDVVLMHLFFDRDVLSGLPHSLDPGGLLLFAQPTVANLERHARPGRRFLLEPGDLEAIVGEMEGIEVLELTEAWRASGRHEARLVARRLPAP